jgi:CRISPR system Cascade subunit CasE
MPAVLDAGPLTATLTRIRLRRSNPHARRDLLDTVALHKTVMRLAPDNLGPHPRQSSGVLFRLEPGPAPTLIVQTTHPPLLHHLPDGYGTAHVHNLSPILYLLTCGMTVRYRITANPITMQPHPTDPDKPQRRTALNGTDATAWWTRRATRAGLVIHTTDATIRAFHRRDPAGPCHSLIQFDGHATITDADQLRHALTQGIGKAKAYGAGLLTLAPA